MSIFREINQLKSELAKLQSELKRIRDKKNKTLYEVLKASYSQTENEVIESIDMK